MLAMGCNPTPNQTLGSLSRPNPTRNIKNQGSHPDYAHRAASEHGASKVKPSATDQAC